jgi:hypothetical protein
MGREAAGGAASGRDGGVLDVASLGEITAEMLREVFPQWWIFPGDGAWWAVRGGIQAKTGPESLLMRALTATDLALLADKLCLQEWLDGLDSAELEAVYRGTQAGGTR